MKEYNYTDWSSLPKVPLKNEVFLRKAEVEADLIKLYDLNNRKRKYRRLVFGFAASFLIVCLGISALYMFIDKSIETRSYALEVNLPDGSEVKLNPDSRLTYNSFKWLFRRDIYLTGSASFQIKSGSPCSVITPLLAVHVIGTRFEILENGDKAQVLCTQGKVRVTTDYMSEDLLPGESVHVSSDGYVKSVEKTVTEQPDNSVLEQSYNSASLTEIAKALSSHYNCSVHVDASVSDYLYSGIIPDDNIDQALGIISECCDIKYSKRDSSVYLFK